MKSLQTKCRRIGDERIPDWQASASIGGLRASVLIRISYGADGHAEEAHHCADQGRPENTNAVMMSCAPATFLEGG